MQDKKNYRVIISRYKMFYPIAGIILGILLFILFFAAHLSGLIFVAAVILLFISIILLKRWWGSYGEHEEKLIITERSVPAGQVNSLDIYPDKIVFEDVTEPEGQPWKCENDGKSYHVHIWDEENKKLKEFQLPDQVYMDPRIFAERVLELPAHRRIFRRKQTLLQQLSPMMGALGVIILWIIIITTT